MIDLAHRANWRYSTPKPAGCQIIRVIRKTQRSDHAPETHQPKNTLFYGDNLPILREYVPTESVDLVYLDPPFNSNRSYNVLFKEVNGLPPPTRRSRPSTIPGNGGPSAQEALHQIELGENEPPFHVVKMIQSIRRVRGPERRLRLPGDDDHSADRAAPRAQAHGQHLPALRPHGQPLSQGGDGYDLWQPDYYQNEIIWKLTTGRP